MTAFILFVSALSINAGYSRDMDMIERVAAELEAEEKARDKAEKAEVSPEYLTRRY